MNQDIEKIYKLSELYDNGESSQETVEELKRLLIPYKDGSIGLAQINPKAGDIEYNASKVVKYITHAQNIGLDLVVFPELVLMGYPIEDTIDRHPIIVEENVKWLKEIAKITTSTTAIVGFVEPRRYNQLTGKKYYNSVAVLSEGSIKGIVRKSLLPTYSEFNDYRYIEPSPVVGSQPGETLGNFDADKAVDGSKINLINSKTYGISICEDCWNNKEFFNENSRGAHCRAGGTVGRWKVHGGKAGFTVLRCVCRGHFHRRCGYPGNAPCTVFRHDQFCGTGQFPVPLLPEREHPPGQARRQR